MGHHVDLDAHTPGTLAATSDVSGDLAARRARADRVRRLDIAFEPERAPAPPAVPLRARGRHGATHARPGAATQSIFGGDFIVLACIGGPCLPITSAAGIARQLRRAL